MPRPRPMGPPQSGPQGVPPQQGFNNPGATFQQKAPRIFQGIKKDIYSGIGNVYEHFGMNSPYAHLGGQLSHPYGGSGGGGKPRNVHDSPDGFQTVDPTTGGETGPQAFGTYAPDINDSQFQNENYGKKGMKGSKAPLGYGGFGGMGGMMGGMMPMMMGGGMDPMMSMFLQMLMGGGGMGGPQVGR